MVRLVLVVLLLIAACGTSKKKKRPDWRLTSEEARRLAWEAGAGALAAAYGDPSGNYATMFPPMGHPMMHTKGIVDCEGSGVFGYR